MIDPIWFATGVAAPAALAAIVLLVGGRRWPDCGCDRGMRAGWCVGLAAGFVVAFLATCKRIQLPPLESHHWLPVAVLPAALVVGLTGATHWPAWVKWSLRGVLAFGMPALLLSSYVRHTWTGGEAALWIAGIGLAILLVSTANRALAGRAQGRSPILAWTVVAGTTGIVAMLTGSQSLGQLGLSLAAMLGGLWLASLRWSTDPGRAVGADVISALHLGLLLQMRFYSETSVIQTIALALLPQIGWLAELPAVQRRGKVVVVLVRLLPLLALALVLVVPAALEFARELEEEDW